MVDGEVKDFFARRLALDWDGFDPSRQAIGEHDELGVPSSGRAEVGRHVEHVAYQAVEGVGADVGSEASALASVRTLGKGALVASQHVVGYVVDHLRPVDHASHRLVGRFAPAVVALIVERADDCQSAATQAPTGVGEGARRC